MKKMPLCLQKDSMQCGIACLQMVCKLFRQGIFYGFPVKALFCNN